MSNLNILRTATVTCLTVLALISVTQSVAADKPNFSGTYSSEVLKQTNGSPTNATLEVTQTEEAIEITWVESGKRATSRCPFNGQAGPYISPGQVSGTCKAVIKGKNLSLESMVVTHPQTSSSPVRIHTIERWQLSSDLQTLTIKSQSDFPDFPAEISGAVASSTSFVSRYRRTGNP